MVIKYILTRLLILKYTYNKYSSVAFRSHSSPKMLEWCSWHITHFLSTEGLNKVTKLTFKAPRIIKLVPYYRLNSSSELLPLDHTYPEILVDGQDFDRLD